MGLDLGTTYSAAAVWRSGVANIVTLGNRSPAIPSIVHVSSSGILVGDAALGRAVSDPAHTAREFKRRLGDPEPVLRDDAGRGWSAHDLSAALASMMLRTVQERQGGPPDEVVLTVPASWSATKRTLFANAIEEIPALAHRSLRTITEPEAAAIHYAANERIEPGEIVAVYDLGGGTFDAALLRRDDHVGETGAGFTLIGRPEGIDRLGGIDFDSALFAQVNRYLGGVLDNVDLADNAVASAMANLRAECVEAKQTLSLATDVSIPVLVPGVPRTAVRVTRHEFEAMIRPALTDTIGALRRALRSVSLAPADVAVVLLVGGSSRIPLVAQLVGAELGRPVAVDAHPKHAVSLGASRSVGAPASTPRPAPEAPAQPAAQPPTQPPAQPPTHPAAQPPTQPPAPVHVERPTAPEPAAAPRPFAVQPLAVTPNAASARSRRGLLLLLAAVGTVVAGLVVFALNRPAKTVGVSAGATSSTQPGTASAVPEVSTSATTGPASSAPVTSAATVIPTTAAGTVASIPVVTTPTPPAACQTATTPFVCLTAIGVDTAQNLVVPFTVRGFSPLIGGPPNQHVHFYFKVGSMADNPANAGSGGPDVGTWIQWDSPSTLGPGGTQKGYTVVNARTVQAKELCALVANSEHVITIGSGNCVSLPGPVVAA